MPEPQMNVEGDIRDTASEIVWTRKIGLDATEIQSPSRAPTSATVLVAAAGTAVRLHAGLRCQRVLIKARAANAGAVFMGPSTITSAGYSMVAGEAIEVWIDNLNLLYVDAANSGDGVHYLAI